MMLRNISRKVEELGRKGNKANKGLLSSQLSLWVTGVQCITCQRAIRARHEEMGILLCQLTHLLILVESCFLRLWHFQLSLKVRQTWSFLHSDGRTQTVLQVSEAARQCIGVDAKRIWVGL